jgi:hypothetical protein
MSKILYLSASDSDLSNVAGTVGLLCEFAPDSPWLSPEHHYFPDQLLGSADDALKFVYPLVTKLLQAVPRTEGVSMLSIYEESLLEQFSYITQALHLDRWICAEGFSGCRFGSYSPWLDRLREVLALTGSEYELIVDLPPSQSSVQRRALKRLWTSRPRATEFFRRVTPLWSRCLSGLPKRRNAKSAPKGGIWFYTTAYNYTKIALAYEQYLPQKLNYLVEDPTTGGKRLRELGHDWHQLYGWARASDIPSPSEVRSIGEQITTAVAAVSVSETENILRTVFLKSEWWHLFLRRWLAFLIFNSRVLRRWYESVVPEMILVGNAAFERALLLHENVRGRVPMVMLQHGIMHWVYGVTDEPVDVFVLRGQFFQRVVSDNLRSKTVILNFPDEKPQPLRQKPAATRDSILFITTPYDVPELFHPADLRDVLRSLLRVSHATGRRLIVRVHPLEKVPFYEQKVAELERELELHADVSYSQGPGVEEALERSCVAVLYFSTMFLDCLRHGIPIVAFGWHWILYKRRFEEERIFNFARDLQDLEALIRQGVEGTLPLRRAGLEQFLAETEAGEISKFFREIWERRSASTNRPLHTLA